MDEKFNAGGTQRRGTQGTDPRWLTSSRKVPSMLISLSHLSGCKFLLHKLIELPLVNQIASNSVEQPVATVLEDLMNSYEEHKNITQYSEAVKRSKQKPETAEAFEPRDLVGAI